MKSFPYWAALLMLATMTVAFGEAPFDFDKTPGKLPKDVRPWSYAVSVTPDVAAKSFTGSVRISIEVRKATNRIVLNSLDLNIQRAVLTDKPDTLLKPVVDTKEQTVSFALDRELAPGAYELTIDFTGKLDERPQGLYIARYQSGGEAKFALATQMEATDARRMFPCWDEPLFRAQFQITATVPEKEMAVSNMPITSEKPAGNGKKTVAFAPTPHMASYLVALGVGEFEEVKGEVDGIQLRILTPPGRREHGLYALEATKQILPFYNEYFGTKYPLPKLDQIAFAATGAGAMENWGLIMYSESALLFDPAKSSQATRQRVFEIIAHEIAHQWFGNLVTMAWWDNLWLNEGFASWMGTKATDRFNPEWKAWLRAAGAKERAMFLDARSTTHPIQQRVATESQANDAFDEITYQKGQSFLRMLESWLGEETFRAGLRAYMKEHAYSSTTTANLWQSLETISGKPVRAMAAGWTEQPGFPLVKVSRSEGTAYRFAQERFAINQKNPPPLRWQIPVAVSDFSAKEMTRVFLLEGDTQEKFGASALPKANAGDVGYYRVEYDRETFDRLVTAMPKLGEGNRLNVLNDTWALVQAGRTPLAQYLDLAMALARDESHAVAEEIIETIGTLNSLARNTDVQEPLQKWAREILAPRLARLGWDAKPGESPLDVQLRNSVIFMLGWIGDEKVIAEAKRRFALFLEKPESLEGNLRIPVFAIVGRYADPATYDQLHTLARREDSYEQKRTIYNALANSRDSALAGKTLALALSDELPSRDIARIVWRVADSGEQPQLAWEYARANLEALLSRLPEFSANDYVPSIFRAFSDEARAAELETFAKNNLPPSAAYAVSKAADDIRFKAALKARVIPELKAWLK